MKQLGIALSAVAMVTSPVWVGWLTDLVIPFISNPFTVFVLLMAAVYGLYALFAFIIKENSNDRTETK